VCAAELVEGLTDAQVQGLFHAAREAQYAELAKEARQLSARGARRTRDDGLLLEVARLRKRLAEIVAIDFLGAPGREAAEGLVSHLEESSALRKTGAAPSAARAGSVVPHAATWVTRRGIHVDRMASAWLIRRFIDPEARLRFVDPRTYQHRAGEHRFDMFEAEFTHEGDLCTFEVLLLRFRLEAPALQAIAEMVHDIDLKDTKFARPETAGFERAIAGIALGHPQDEVRLERASALLDDLHTAFERFASRRQQQPASRKPATREKSRRRSK
jgi:Uncharacterized conserved protein